MVDTGTFRQQAELRKHKRQPLHYPAWIFLAPDRQPLQCMLSDVSKSGAKITLGAAADIPDQFMLLLSADGKTRRKCRVAWREAKRLGVEFLGAPIDSPDDKSQG